jgi:hypothetical protein
VRSSAGSSSLLATRAVTAEPSAQPTSCASSLQPAGGANKSRAENKELAHAILQAGSQAGPAGQQQQVCMSASWPAAKRERRQHGQRALTAAAQGASVAHHPLARLQVV